MNRSPHPSESFVLNLAEGAFAAEEPAISSKHSADEA
jgi:hypothetical protein